MALILDTGPLYATLDRDDAAYRSCRRLVEESGERLVIPSPVLVEVDYWIHQRLHPGILVALLDDIDAGDDAAAADQSRQAVRDSGRHLWHVGSAFQTGPRRLPQHKAMHGTVFACERVCDFVVCEDFK